MNPVVVVIPAAVILMLFSSPVMAKPAPLSDKVWVIVRPVQCLGNPWEKDWLAKHHNQVTKYPRQKESDIVKSFFGKKNVQILELRSKRYVNGDSLCNTCDCSRGDTLYFLISVQDIGKMVGLGYTERVPANAVPLKK